MGSFVPRLREQMVLVRLMSIAVSALILATAVPDTLEAMRRIDTLGWDYDLYRSATERWLGGGPFYEPYQLQGPYAIAHGDILYPPVAIWLFAPFTVLPSLLWWAVPAAIIVASVVRLRPGPLAWPLIALCLAWPPTLVKVAAGNPLIWVVAAMSVGVVIAGPAVFVLIKTSLAPFALWGINRRAWWLHLGALILMSLPFGAMWVDWATAIANSRGGGLIYSWQEAPTVLLPIAAWWGRRFTLRNPHSGEHRVADAREEHQRDRRPDPAPEH